MLTIRAMSDGRGYSARHLEHNDYYAEGERVIGQWFGRGAELLGLSGGVEARDFEAVRQGLDPNTHEFLRLRHSADRKAGDGTMLAQGRSLYDFTISAPKSISVMASVGGDERLVAAHQTAAAEALREMEMHAAGRVRQGGANENRVTSNIIIAVYHHDTSRELDPQLHTHAVAANLTYDGAEGRWKALQASEIYERRAYLTEVYRNALAREVRGLGYEVRNTHDAKGRDTGLEIQGISETLLRKYSQRSQQRDAAIEAFAAKNGRQPTDNEVAVLVRATRANILTEVTAAEVRRRQRERLTPIEARELTAINDARQPKPAPLGDPGPSLEYAKDHVFERKTVASDHEVLTEALRHGRGHIAMAELKGQLALQQASGSVLRSRDEIATKESLDRERSMIATVNRGIGTFAPLGNGAFAISDQLRPEQRAAVTFILGSRDRAVSLSGAAGTGKTATLRELHRGLNEAGQQVIAIAPTMGAVEELQKVGFVGAMSISRMLKNEQAQSSLRGSVVIVDEAGMISTQQMADILKLAERHDARLIFSGDTKQIQSVEAGDALAILKRESMLKTVSLTQVQRQTRKGYREAIEELRANPDRGFAKLEAIGAVREVKGDQRAHAVAEAYAAAAGKSSLVVCATHDEIERVTDAIRERRRESGQLGESVVLERHVSLNWTTAQKSSPKNYQVGQVLGFHRAVQGINKNETVEVVGVDERGITVRTPVGERRITGKQASCFDVLERRSIEVASGDRLLFTANRRDSGFRAINGEIGTVRRVEAGRIHLDDGRTLPANFKQFAHGYAVTAHRSQGKSVDSVIISADGMQRELFYVAASRGREGITVITRDRQRLRQTVGQSMARKSASELARGARQCHPRGFRQGISAARDLIKRAAEYVAFLRRRISQQRSTEPTHRKERTHERSFGR